MQLLVCCHEAASTACALLSPCHLFQNGTKVSVQLRKPPSKWSWLLPELFHTLLSSLLVKSLLCPSATEAAMVPNALLLRALVERAHLYPSELKTGGVPSRMGGSLHLAGQVSFLVCVWEVVLQSLLNLSLMSGWSSAHWLQLLLWRRRTGSGRERKMSRDPVRQSKNDVD